MKDWPWLGINLGLAADVQNVENWKLWRTNGSADLEATMEGLDSMTEMKLPIRLDQHIEMMIGPTGGGPNNPGMGGCLGWCWRCDDCGRVFTTITRLRNHHGIAHQQIRVACYLWSLWQQLHKISLAHSQECQPQEGGRLQLLLLWQRLHSQEGVAKSFSCQHGDQLDS